MVPVSNPDFIGEYTIVPMLCFKQNGRISVSTSGEIAEYGGCKEVTGPIGKHRSNCDTLKLDTPIQRTLPCFFRSFSAPHASSTSSFGSGQWIWYRSITSVFSRRRLASHSLRTESALSIPLISPFSFHVRSHLVKT